MYKVINKILLTYYSKAYVIFKTRLYTVNPNNIFNLIKKRRTDRLAEAKKGVIHNVVVPGAVTIRDW